jgi:hypothetical protein
MRDSKITPVHYEVLIKIFEIDGFAVQRKRGDYIIMTKPGIMRPAVDAFYR